MSRGTILHRLGRALRDQNWFAVVLEIVIVTVGVLMGIQVSNWNDERREQRELEQMAGRLLEDFRDGRDDGPQVANYYQSRIDLGKKTEALWSARDRDLEFVTAAYLTGSYAAVLDRDETSYRLAVGADSIAKIDDDHLRTAIVEAIALRSDDYLNWAYVDSDFRRLVRRLYPIGMQERIFEACNSLSETVDIAEISTTDCDIDLPASEVEAVAASLRQDPQALGLLREHVNRLGGAHVRMDAIGATYDTAVQAIEATQD